MQHAKLTTITRAAATVAALTFGIASFAQTSAPATVSAYPNANGTTTYITPSGSTTVVNPTPPTSPAPVATATVPAGTTYGAPAAAPAPATAPTATYVAPAPATTYVAPATTTVVSPAPAAAPISAAGRDYDHVRVSMTPATGYPTGDQVPTTSQKLIDGANWIRKELIRDIDIAHQDITIVPANARITLYGTVPNEAMLAKIEGIARTAGSPNVVVSELKVR